LSPADRQCTAKGTSHLHHTVRRYQRLQGRSPRRVQPRISPCRRRRRLSAAPGDTNMPRPRTARYPSFTQGVKNMLLRQLVHPDHRTGRTDHHPCGQLGDPCSFDRLFSLGLTKRAYRGSHCTLEWSPCSQFVTLSVQTWTVASGIMCSFNPSIRIYRIRWPIPGPFLLQKVNSLKITALKVEPL
jgi:hypothetical protein